ncbi:MAG TPA: hypothetical protein VMT70_00845, partial [Vicinamibacteria bacterium]|nr:hypothetical protein [Vicinamibacteria bacterium]
MTPLKAVRRAARPTFLGCALLVLVAAAAEAQAPPVTQTSGTGQGTPERPGLFRVGALYLTPYLQIGSLGIDTNVFYTATERQTDFAASGGPGLEVVRPFGRESRVRLDGGIDYLYFARTDSQRKLNGYGTAQLDLVGVNTRLAAEEHYASSFSRPN